MLNGLIGFVIGLVVGSMTGFIMCAVGVAASSSRRMDDYEQIEWLEKRRKQEDDSNDWK